MDTNTPSPPPERFGADLKDYSGTVIDVRQSMFEFFWQRHPIHSFFVFVVPICATLVISYLEYATLSSATQSDGTLRGAVIVALLPLIIPLVSYWHVKLKIEKVFYTELATALGLSYAATGTVPTSGKLFTFGRGGSVSNVLSGTYQNYPIRLFDYEYVTGDSKHEQRHYYTAGEFTVPGTLPHILGKPHSWSDMFNQWEPSTTAPLALEGDFNTKFDVYATHGGEIEALQVLEPDVMAKLMDGFDHYGFETIGSKVYLFTGGTMAENRESVIGTYTLLKRFCDTLSPELGSFERR